MSFMKSESDNADKSQDTLSFRPQAAGRGGSVAAEKGSALFFAKEYTYTKEQLLALRPRTRYVSPFHDPQLAAGAIAPYNYIYARVRCSGRGVTSRFDGNGLPSSVYSSEPLPPASVPGPVPMLPSG